MFIGHYAPAFVASAVIASRAAEREAGIAKAAGKANATGKAASTISPAKSMAWLGIMFIAAQLVDFGFFAFVLIGIEYMRIAPGISAMVPFDLYYMPYTHSLFGTLLWAAGFGFTLLLIFKNRAAAIAGFLVVVSHWFLDLIVHVPDLTLAGGQHKIGLGLWNHPIVAMPLELGITLLSFLYYLRCTKASGQHAKLWAAILAAVLLLVQIINWFGPAPKAFSPDIAWSALAVFAVLGALAHWTARQRAGL